MGSLRAKQGSYIEIVRAIQSGALQPLTYDDLAWAETFIRQPSMFSIAEIEAWLKRRYCDSACKLYLPFDETSGSTAHDLSGYGNTGTATGTTIVDGVFGKARSFDGLDDYVSIPTSAELQALTSSTDWSIGCFVKTTQTGAADLWTPGIIEKRALEQWGDRVFVVSIDTNGKAQFGYVEHETQTSYFAVSTTTVNDGNWHFIVGVNDNGTYRLYVDGVQEDTVAGSYSQSSSDGITVGCRRTDLGDSSSFFDGIIDEVRIYSRALTADEVYLHYLAGALKLGLI